jgi:hypothetical protein
MALAMRNQQLEALAARGASPSVGAGACSQAAVP